jgi:hypothetical protein
MTIFISYSRRNREKVLELAEDLKLFDQNVWFDSQLANEGGHLWWGRILKEIRECEFFVFALSAASLKSKACLTELNYAAALHKTILPVLIAEDVAISFLPTALQVIQIHDHRESGRSQLVALRNTLRSLPLSPSLPDPLPPEPAAPLDELSLLRQGLDPSETIDETASFDSIWEKLTTVEARRQFALYQLSNILPNERQKAIRALRYLEDSTPPSIPLHVARRMMQETDLNVREDTLRLLESRATSATTWRPMAYDSMTDRTLGTLAIRDSSPKVREQAARVTGSLHSQAAVAAILEEMPLNSESVLQALIFVRDEARQIPPNIPAQSRVTLLTHLIRYQLFHKPITPLFFRITLGWGIALGVYNLGLVATQTVTGTGSLILSTILNTVISYGILFSLATQWSILLAQRLTVFNRRIRIGLSIFVGGLLYLMAFFLFRSLYNNKPNPLDQPAWFIFPAVLPAIGFATGSLFRGRVLAKVLIGTLGLTGALLINWWARDNQLTDDYFFLLDPKGGFTSTALGNALLIGLVVSVCTYLPELIRLGYHNIQIIRARRRRLA